MLHLGASSPFLPVPGSPLLQHYTARRQLKQSCKASDGSRCVDSVSGPAGMVHAFIICSGAAFAAAYSTGNPDLMIHLHHVGVKRLECSEEIVRAPCRGSSSSTAHERLCVSYTYYQLTSVQRARHVCVFVGRESAETPREGTIISAIPFR